MQDNIFNNAGIHLSQETIESFDEYRELILEYNKVMDITNITDYEDMYIKHFVDSIFVNKSGLDFSSIKLIDIGTGGGFPGIPLKLVYPDLKLTLLDSLKKRIKFLDDLVNVLSLKDVSTLHGRAEDYAIDSNYREVYDIAISRAVAQLRTLVEYCLAYVKVGGYFIAMKGPNYKEELDQAKKAISIMGGKLQKVIEYSLPGDHGDRSLILIKKIKATPKGYPRNQAKPKNNPL